MALVRLARVWVLLAWGLVVYGQDASLVLRTSVTYRTQRNSLQLSDEQKQQADRYAREAQTAEGAGDHGEAIRSFYHGMAVMRNAQWTPALEFGSSLQARLDHAMIDPGSQVRLTLTPLYRSEGAKLDSSLYLVTVPRSSGVEKKLLDTPIDPAAMAWTLKIALPEDAAGDYLLELRLPSGIPAKTLPLHIEALNATAERLRARVAKSGRPGDPAMPNAAYAVALFDRADRGEVNPAAYKFKDEFARSNEILDALDAGRDPFAGKHGDFRKAYRSKLDDTLQPYRLLVPEAYSASKPAPLLVALHGMGGDENSMFDGYGGVLKREAERVGFLTVCPKGRDSASMYIGNARQDVLDVIAEVRRDYNVDPGRIYLMGHSMGGYGTWSLAVSTPELFAALGPISGGGAPSSMAKIANIPQYVVHGDADPTVPVAQSRAMVEAGKKAGAKIVYVEVPGGNHTNIAAPQFGPMLDFFARQRRGGI